MNDYEYEKLLKSGFKLDPCHQCGGQGRETVGDGRPVYIAGVSLGPSLGNIVVCENCGYTTQAYRGPWQAIAEWNRKADPAKPVL